MEAYLRHRGIRLFAFKEWAAPLREQVRAHAQQLAQENGLAITHVRSSRLRKEDLVAKIVAKRGTAPGLVAILSAMEACPSFEPWHDKRTHETTLRYQDAKCLHYYFYVILEDLGLCYLRVPTWAPFRLQFYCNGHGWLASRLRQAGVEFEMADNAFVHIADYAKAQRLADRLEARALHRRLDQLARRLCPVVRQFPQGIHWSLMQAEYATDVVFRSQADLRPLYEEITRTAIHSVKPENIATFWGRQLHCRSQQAIGNDFHTRVEGTRIKHQMGPVSIKLYDKYGLVLRVETTVNDVSFFQQYREVRHRDGTAETKWAVMKKHLYSLGPLRETLTQCNRRYLDYLSAIDDPRVPLRDLDRLAQPVRQDDRSWRGFNVFDEDDAALLRTVLRGEFCAQGFRNAHLRRHLPDKTPGQLSRMLKRLRLHGLIKKTGRRYKYYLTDLGRRVGAAALRLKEMFFIPALRGVPAMA
jgi:hypothetical protein